MAILAFAGASSFVPARHAEAQTPREHVAAVTSTGATWIVTPAANSTVMPDELLLRVTGDAPVGNLRLGFADGFDDTAAILAAVAPAHLADAARVRALFDFVLARYYQWASPSDWTGHGYTPARFLQFYGYGLCNDAAAAFGALALRAGYPVRIWNPGDPPQHVVAEVFYDAGWHMFDANWPAFYLLSDGVTVASVEDLIADPSIIEAAGPSHEALVDLYAATPAGTHQSLTAPMVPNEEPIAWNLWPGDAVRFSPVPLGRHVDDNTWPTAEPPSYASGQLQVAITAADVGAHGRIVRMHNLERREQDGRWGWAPLDRTAPASMLVRVDVPYPLVDVRAVLTGTRLGEDDRLTVGAVRDADGLRVVESDWLTGLAASNPAFVRSVGIATIEDDGYFPILHAAAADVPAEVVYRVRNRSAAARLHARVYRLTTDDVVAVEVSPDDETWLRIWEPESGAIDYLEVDLALPAYAPDYLVRVVLTSRIGGWSAGIARLVLTDVDVPDPAPTAVWTGPDGAGASAMLLDVDLSPGLTPRRSRVLHSYLVQVGLEAGSDGDVSLESLSLTSTFQTSRFSPARLRSGDNPFALSFDATGPTAVAVTHRWWETPRMLPPPAPLTGLLSDGTVVDRGEPVTLSWDEQPQATAYRVRVCADHTCQAPLYPEMDLVFVAPGDAGRVTWRVPGPARLVPGARYYWRAYALDAEGASSGWSEARSFSMEANFGLTVDGEDHRILELPWTTVTGRVSSPLVSSIRWSTDRGDSGVAEGITHWTLSLQPQAGTTLLTIEALGPLDGPERHTIRLDTHPRRYLLAEGATGTYFDTTVSVANPYPLSAPFRLRLLGAAGVVVEQDYVLEPWGRQAFDLDALVQHSTLALSTEVVSLRGVPLVVERMGTWGDGAEGGHATRALTTLSTEWYFAEGSQGYFDTYWLVVNPHPYVVSVDVSFLLDAGGIITQTHDVQAESRLNVFSALVPGLEGRSFAATFRATADIAVERAMYFPAGGPWTGGHAATGAVAPGVEWYFAEGATGSMFDTFLLLGNPGATPVDVTVRYLLPNGQSVVRQRQIAGHSRATVWVDADPSLGTAEMSIVVTATGPIVAERAMYWPLHAGVWEDGHAVLGGQAAATRWGVADVRTAGTRAYDTYLLVANPNATDAVVRVEFFGGDGTAVKRRYDVRAGSRFTISTAIMVPELAAHAYAAIIESVNGVPIHVEAATYWSVSGRHWAGGAARRATPLPPVP